MLNPCFTALIRGSMAKQQTFRYQLTWVKNRIFYADHIHMQKELNIANIEYVIECVGRRRFYVERRRKVKKLAFFF
jgi:hypothetical protein